MKDTRDEAASSTTGLNGQKPAIQVICLGSGGGPSEENVTGFLVRSVGSNWAKGSLLAVDAGSHLAPITRILERDFPTVSRDRTRLNSHSSIASSSNGSRTLNRRPLSPITDGDEPPRPEPTVLATGPFAGLRFPNESARANALHVLRTYISTYLITHPHLDHISGFTINTAAFHATSRPKTLAALPSTVNAIKEHIFNDVIWPNLSDEDGGVGFVTFQRLKEGGDVMVGEGEGRGYIEVCDGLATRAFKVSHGCCTKSPPSHQHRGSMASITLPDSQPPYNGSILGTSQDVTRSLSLPQMHSNPGTPNVGPRPGFHTNHPSPHVQSSSSESACVVDSTAYFLRDEDTHREVLIFGDVEPDSLSLSPRTYIVWQEAARKVAHDVLGGIFIECSYDDSQADAVLFGHLNPKHLIAELQNLANMVIEAKASRAVEQGTRKRKRSGPNGLDNLARSAGSEGSHKRSRSIVNQSTFENTRRSSASNEVGNSDPNSSSPSGGSSVDHYELHVGSDSSIHSLDAMSPRSVTIPRSNAVVSSAGPVAGSSEMPLSGIRVVIIHVKDTLKDGPHVSENILAQLQEYEARLQEQGQGLGCEFVIAQSGESYWF